MTDRRGGFVRAVGVALLAALAAGCAPRTTVVLLPEKDGRQAAVTVTQGDKTFVLDEPYEAVKQGAFGTTAEYKSDPKEVEAIAGPALAAQPARRASFTLYFVEGKDEFTEESKQVVETVFAEIAKRPLPDVVVVGHTDLTGTDQINDALGQRRADYVKRQLVARRVPAENVEAISRGMRDPVVPTARGVAEARNRRVEIVVR
jgi:outer membrane protein OmpA-like peptidoglycan-associated protein